MVDGVPSFIPADRLTHRVAREKAEEVRTDVEGLRARLEKTIRGEVCFDDGSRRLYAQDASNYWQIPIGVVIPRDKEDVLSILDACRGFGAPVVSRGGGTALAGQTCNEAVVIDFSKYMRRIVEVSPRGKFARVEPGVVCDDLVRAARPFGLTWGPKPATHDHCCFGGMIANNCGGMHAQMHGVASHNVEELDIALYDGTKMRLGWMVERDLERAIDRGGREGAVCAALRSLRDRYASQIRARFPRFPRRVSGYNLAELLPGEDGRFNLARSLVGSEGTCVTMLEAKVVLVDEPPAHAVVILGYRDVFEAGDHVPDVLAFRPTALEGMDDLLRDLIVRKGGRHARDVEILPEAGGWLLVEIGGGSQEEARSTAERLCRAMERSASPPVASTILESEADQTRLWAVRDAGLGSTAFVPGLPDTWPGWEDSAVPPEQLGDYLRRLRALFDEYGYHPALYGHFGMGCVHCRVDFDLVSAKGIEHYRAFVEHAADLVVGHGGSFSGEHGDGQSRAELLVKMFGPELVQAFREFKSIWDPDGKMNPGKIVDPYRLDENLRLGAVYAPWEPATHFHYGADHGSFSRATLRCVGVGKCRRTSAHGVEDVMCPSYMVTLDEKHCTRGRAHLLWEMLRGGPGKTGWRDEAVKESLDLCLSCKGCKGECPVNVDMATYKAEFLSHYYEGRLRPRHAYAFGFIDKWARLASLAPGIANLVTQLPVLRSLAKLAAGIQQERSLPPFAAQTFRSWFLRRPRKNAGAPRVVLFPDTFNDHFFPDTLQAAVEVLEAAGREVELPREPLCCGRPLYDFGMLDSAKRYLERVLAGLEPQIRAGSPIVVLEPSCCSVFRDELLDLLPNRDLAQCLSRQTMLLSEFLQQCAKNVSIPELACRAIVQGHCHHKSVLGFDDGQQLLSRLGLGYEILDSGCCGMAGAFGFQTETYAVAQACGERVLLPCVREAPAEALVIADGFSCREQIAQNTPRRALHTAEVVKMALDGGPPMTAHPEDAVVALRGRAVRRSMLRGAATMALFATGSAGLWALWNGRNGRRAPMGTRRALRRVLGCGGGRYLQWRR